MLRYAPEIYIYGLFGPLLGGIVFLREIQRLNKRYVLCLTSLVSHYITKLVLETVTVKLFLLMKIT